MKGSILDYQPDSRSGVISGDDGQRYQFDASQWQGSEEIGAGRSVDFVANGDKAESIYPDKAAANNAASTKKIAAALLAFFLGAFGAHKFYLGYTKQGVIMLVVFLLGFILLGLPSIVIGVIAFVEFVIYLTKSDDEFDRIYVQGVRPWF